ncbi:MAG: FliH/SctL family protein [Thermodesulfobacteriota bacterium]
MSKIFPSGSGVYFETVRFKDLEAGSGSGDKGFFGRKCPAELKALEEEAPGEQSESPADEAPAVDVEAIKEEAHGRGREEGYAQGRKDGRSEVEKELHTATQALADGLEQISRLRESLLNRSKEDMIRLVMAVSRQVIQAEIEEKSDFVVKTVSRAIEAAVESDEYYIKVNPADLEQVRANEPLFLASMKGLENIHFIADESISRGGCRAESREGDVDATIESQMEKIEEHLRAEI